MSCRPRRPQRPCSRARRRAASGLSMADLIEVAGLSRKDLARHGQGLAKFGAVGVFNVATEFTVFGLMIAAGVTPVVANAFGFLCANGQSYLANASFTFRENGKGAPLSLRAYARFFAAHCAALGVSTTFLIALGPAIGLFEAKALAVGVSFVLNYAMSAAFVFGRQASTQGK
ncbi:MAG TPA: hypothetical protein DDZ68_02500 [Parvularcula sp.]|nr:hypothetical protein [Parvularcula sp.]